MSPSELLAKLTQLRGVRIAEQKILEDGRSIHVIEAVVPDFPFGKDRRVWYALVVSPNQTTVPQSEIEAILRRLWHLGTDLASLRSD